ncbi:ribosome-binding factor A [Paramagnetospirillum kuznetsovii]|uniref:Ribosome-binding factor A n=1 Tax=Paramagnetospirillum kuznetsovii TaxID=2053833 RepID=A0A364NY50_9PROT|nr:30S ribosome-binding factor RbfA [Paramagnetospirillum kuznetsovii]RAU21920.1 ribosome-binding factor A [Paramagnetospirillum kuznetsovii]
MPRGDKAPTQRQLRVGEELRHAIANVIERGEFRDPDLQGRPITVTEVRVSPDLRNATVFVVPLGGGDSTPILAGLKRAKSFLRHEISRSVQLRAVPDLAFQPDTSFDEASRIEDILRSPVVRRDIGLEDDFQTDGDDGE